VSKIFEQHIPIIAIIPARGGSKSVPRKNLQNLNGSPLISYSIDSALRSELIQDVYVSTEDAEIAQISKMYGAQVIDRPDSMAMDLSRDSELLENAIENEFSSLPKESLIVFLRPSHPLRNPATIDAGIRAFLNVTEFDCLRSMKLSTEIPYKMWRLNHDGSAIQVADYQSIDIPDPSNAPRQVLPKTYYQDGYVDIFPFRTVLKYGNTSGEKVLPFIIDEFSHDIDTFQDLAVIDSQLKSLPWPSWYKSPTPIL
jgi:CMP-N-acetylneuraminic acid synthetase